MDINHRYATEASRFVRELMAASFHRGESNFVEGEFSTRLTRMLVAAHEHRDFDESVPEIPDIVKVPYVRKKGRRKL